MSLKPVREIQHREVRYLRQSDLAPVCTQFQAGVGGALGRGQSCRCHETGKTPLQKAGMADARHWRDAEEPANDEPA
ncbi:MAG: hypothetical protein AB9907_10675 [Flexilinea sp.]